MKRSDLDIATDRLFLGDESEWPRWPMLPIKHSHERDASGLPLMGILLAGDRETIYLANMYKITSYKDLDSAEKRTFTDRESMILHGWVVD